MPDPYKACGAQLDYHPEARGIPYDEWEKKRPLWTPAERLAWIKKHTAPPEDKKKKPASGALPNNQEWL